MSDIPDCRECGAQLELDADELWWVCKNKSCPHYLERQVRAFEMGDPEGIGDVKPVETEPTPSRKGRRAWSRKQEPPCAMVAPFEGPSGPSTEMR